MTLLSTSLSPFVSPLIPSPKKHSLADVQLRGHNTLFYGGDELTSCSSTATSTPPSQPSCLTTSLPSLSHSPLTSVGYCLTSTPSPTPSCIRLLLFSTYLGPLTFCQPKIEAQFLNALKSAMVMEAKPLLHSHPHECGFLSFRPEAMVLETTFSFACLTNQPPVKSSGSSCRPIQKPNNNNNNNNNNIVQASSQTRRFMLGRYRLYNRIDQYNQFYLFCFDLENRYNSLALQLGLLSFVLGEHANESLDILPYPLLTYVVRLRQSKFVMRV